MPEQGISDRDRESLDGAAAEGVPEFRSGSSAVIRSIFFGNEGLRAGWSLLFYLILIAALLVPARGLFRRDRSERPSAGAAAERPPQGVLATVRNDGVLFLIVGLGSLVMSRVERRPLWAYGIGATPGAAGQFAAGVLWGVAFLSLLVLLLRSTHLLVFDGRLLAGKEMLRFGAEWAVGFLLVGLFEEYFLRGFLQFTLARGFAGIYGAVLKSSHRDALGFWTAALVLSFVFGIGHRSNPGESSIGLLTAGAAALVFSLSLWRTGSLWWAIGFHAAWDWTQSFLYGVADSGMMVRHHLLWSHAAGRPFLSGGLTGPEGSVFVFPVLLLVAAVIWGTLRQVRRPIA